MNKTKIVTQGIVALFAVVLTVSAASAVPTFHFVPQDITVPEGYCHSIDVGIYLNLSAGDNVRMGQFGFSYDPLCGDITDRTLNAGYPPDYPINQDWSSWNTSTYPECWNDIWDWIVFDFWYPHDGPEDILIGTITLHCNSTEYYTNEMNFGDLYPPCPMGPIILWDADYEEVSYSTISGTFTCGEVPPPLIFEKELGEGWNMISLPLYNETDMTVATIIDESLSGSYSDLYKYDAVTKDWVPLSSSDTMENGVGYFINMTAIGTWNYSGLPYNRVEVSLSEGLNCIGWTNTSANINVTEENALGLIADKYNYVAQWNNAPSPKYEVYEQHAPDVFNDFWTMERGDGYWIAAKEDCILEYP